MALLKSSNFKLFVLSGVCQLKRSLGLYGIISECFFRCLIVQAGRRGGEGVVSREKALRGSANIIHCSAQGVSLALHFV